MIQDIDLKNHARFFQMLGKDFVFLTWLEFTGRVIVNANNGNRKILQGPLEDFP